MSQILQAAEQMRLPSAALALLRTDMAPEEAVQSLFGAQRRHDALFLALRLLPKPYAVAWLCQCARAQSLDAHDAQGLHLAQDWVQQPDESRRLAALAFADAADYQTIGAWLGAAAGWADGSLSGEGGPPTADHLTASAAVAALLHLAGREPDSFEEQLDRWLDDVCTLLAGTRWQERGA